MSSRTLQTELRASVGALKHQYRFFLPKDSIDGNTVTFPENVSRQLRAVLRLKSGDVVIVLDGSGQELLVELQVMGSARIAGNVVDRMLNKAEPTVGIALFQGLPKVRKLETIWQQCTELGVSSLTPVECERSEAGAPTAARRTRLEAIVREAVEQSGRGMPPQLKGSVTFQRALEVDAELRLIFTPSSQAVMVSETMCSNRPSTVAILVGPEGGLSPNEIAAALEQGWKAVSLGPRVLRTETASVVACALVLNSLGEI